MLTKALQKTRLDQPTIGREYASMDLTGIKAIDPSSSWGAVNPAEQARPPYREPCINHSTATVGYDVGGGVAHPSVRSQDPEIGKK
jgi:hypothetical protein